jgi:type II secretory pathway pseudopilin PulG
MHNMKGFTLLETLIYIAIASIVVTSFVTFALSISDSRNKASVAQEVQANVRIALDLIRQKIYASEGVVTASSVFDADPGSLVLSMPVSAENPTVINLDQDDGTLGVTMGSSATISVTSSDVAVTNLVFTNLSGISGRDTIQVDLTVAYKEQGSAEFTYEQSVRTAVGTWE